MGRRHAGRRKQFVAIVAIVLILTLALVGVHVYENKTSTVIPNAGEQMTAHTAAVTSGQVYMNDQWYAERNVETLLVLGVDDYTNLHDTDSYNSGHQTDFLVLFVRDVDTGKTAAIHINRDTMTDITTLGVTGQPTGTIHAQLALAYNYGNSSQARSRNTVNAVKYLFYGVQIDHYITITMDAVPILNDWAGGVTVEVLDDFTAIDSSLVPGELVRLDGTQALTYVRTRYGLDDSTNLHRMERQQQYAEEWIHSAQGLLNDAQAVTDLVIQLDGYYHSDCTADELSSYAEGLSLSPSAIVYQIEGDTMQGDVYMEFHVDEEYLQQLVLELFYIPVN